MLKSLINFLFPPVCHICGVGVDDSSKPLCPLCRSQLPRTRYHLQPSNPMEQRFAGIFPFERAAGHIFYQPQSDLASLIHDFKYRKFRGIARYLGNLIGEELLVSGFVSDIDFIVPIPMHFIKKGFRGYNQTEELALGIAEATGLQISTALYASKPHKTQTRLSHEQRKKNTSGIFRLTKSHPFAGKHILILDDICTTGATLTAASESVLAASPSTRISLYTLGVTF